MAEPQSGDQEKQDFLYPRSHYRGQFTPEHLVFNANLQEFAQRIGYICALETGGKVSPEQAFAEIKNLWKQLKRSKEKLDISDASEEN